MHTGQVLGVLCLLLHPRMLLLLLLDLACAVQDAEEQRLHAINDILDNQLAIIDLLFLITGCLQIHSTDRATYEDSMSSSLTAG